MSLQATMRALADPTRREILDILKGGALSAGEISERFEISAAAISRHLSVLREADLIRDNRDGKFIYYELNASVLEEIILWVKNLEGTENEENDQKIPADADNNRSADTFADSFRLDSLG